MDRIVRALYVRTLGRAPTSAEASRARTFVDGSATENEGLEDVFWALIGSTELSTVR